MFLTKLRVTLPVYLIISLSCVLGLVGVRWLFDIQFHLLGFKEEVWEFWLPFILPIVPVLIWLRPRVRILNFKDNDKGRTGIVFLSCLAIILSMLISQSYLTTATGALVEISDINKIDEDSPVRYYKIRSFTLIPGIANYHTEVRPSGKNNQYLNFTHYFVVGMDPKIKGQQQVAIIYWYGLKFDKQISNNLSDQEKE